jgi:hypothetical protein
VSVFRASLDRMRREQAQRALAPSLLDPQDNQTVFWWQTLRVACPDCVAEAEEPCAPFSLSRPHVGRVRLAEQETE